jgi:hypothetical protein
MISLSILAVISFIGLLTSMYSLVVLSTIVKTLITLLVMTTLWGIAGVVFSHLKIRKKDERND